MTKSSSSYLNLQSLETTFIIIAFMLEVFEDAIAPSVYFYWFVVVWLYVEMRGIGGMQQFGNIWWLQQLLPQLFKVDLRKITVVLDPATRVPAQPLGSLDK